MDALIHRDAEALTELFRDELRRGRPWLEALFHVISLWEIGEETTDGQHYRYLIGGEALDWLRLAERLCADAAGLLPDEEVEALLVEGRFPAPLTEERLQEYLGPTKYRAHLNFVYGVRVEEALHLAVEEAVQKERRSRATGYDARVDEDVFQRIYGAPAAGPAGRLPPGGGTAAERSHRAGRAQRVHLLALQAAHGHAGPRARGQRHAPGAADTAPVGRAPAAAPARDRPGRGHPRGREPRDPGALMGPVFP